MPKTAPRTRMLRKAAIATAVAPTRAVKLADEGIVVAIVAVTGVVDAVGDLIVPGAFAHTLKLRRPKVVDDHEWQRKVGRTLHAEEWLPGDPRLPKRTKDGKPWPKEAGALVATMQYNLATERGRESFADVKFYAESNEAEFSIGYKVPPGKARKRSDSVRVILLVNLFEFSHVLFGAAPLSMALEVKSMHGGSAGTTTSPSLTPSKRTATDDEDEPDYPKPPEVDMSQPWEKERAGIEAKTAADVLLEAKSDLAPEVKSMDTMKGSYEERRTLIQDAARDLLEVTDNDLCFVSVVATFDGEAIVSAYSEDGPPKAYLLPYNVTEDGVELGEPQPVELSLVAEANQGETPAESVEEITVVEPAYSSADFLATVVSTFDAAQSQEKKDAAAAIRNRFAEALGLEAKSGGGDGPVPEGTIEESEEPAEADEDTITSATLPEGDWAEFVKTAPIEAVRMDGQFKVKTREGVVECEDGWLAIDSDGYPYPIAAEEFDEVYVPADTATSEDELSTKDADEDLAETDAQEAPEAPADGAPEDSEERVTLDPDEHFANLEALEAD